ncbi:MAG: TetR/AcrR family transcriptional regulator [Deltaproteobacteria bacterium]|jgi:TetR/AcrR family transcriptional repressor of nem operon|nr:TetR/AcrR family transcriptional regulator [Deltaproteobacteria bacterium]
MILKEKIIHESLKLFSLKGFTSTSIQDILAAAHTSKGGFYNHFSSKEDLFYQVLDEARKIWRDRNLNGLKQADSSLEKVILLLQNYKDLYLKDADNFPGGCVFITLSVELSDQIPHLSKEIEKGFIGLKNLYKRFLDEGKESGELNKNVDTDAITEMIFNSMLGASVIFNANKSTAGLDKSVNSLIEYLNQLKQ